MPGGVPGVCSSWPWWRSWPGRCGRSPRRRPFTPAGAPAPDRARLPVGLAEDGTCYRLQLLGRHVLVVGASGAGKASVFWSILTAVAPLVRVGSVVLHGIDPKRMELVF